jgi:hypothetical protein
MPASWPSSTSSKSNLRPQVRPKNLAPGTVITISQTGTDWVDGGSGRSSDDTTEFVLGSQSKKLLLSGVNGQRTEYGRPSTSGAIDATGKQFRIWIKAQLIARSDVWFFVSSDNYVNYGVIVIPFNSMKYARDGEWVAYTFSWADFTLTGAPNRAALTAMKIAAVDIGGGAQLPVWFGGVELINEPASAICTVMFNDAKWTFPTYAKPKMDSVRMVGTMSVIADVIDSQFFMSKKQLQVAQDTGFDICAHSNTLANHNLGYENLSDAQAEAELAGVKSWLLDNNFNAADYFVWPKGSFSASQLTLAKKYYSVIRTTASGQIETSPPADWTRLRCMTVIQGTTTAQIQAALTKAISAKQWLILLFHDIHPAPPGGDDFYYSQANFNAAIDAIVTSGISVKTLSAVI